MEVVVVVCGADLRNGNWMAVVHNRELLFGPFLLPLASRGKAEEGTKSNGDRIHNEPPESNTD